MSNAEHSGAIYDDIGAGYAVVRRREPRIYEEILRALEGCQSIVNVGAGAGSYEPDDGRWVLGVEPSATMIRQRAPNAAPCIQGVAEHLPFLDDAVDATTAFLTIHHWTDLERGIAELRRVAKRRVVLFTWLTSFARTFWFTEHYVPEIAAYDEPRFPSIDELTRMLGGGGGGGDVRTITIPVPHDCVDGFYGAYWRRPHAYLDPHVRAGISVLEQIPQSALRRGLEALERDLESGQWALRFKDLLTLESMDLGYRLVVLEKQ